MDRIIAYSIKAIKLSKGKWYAFSNNPKIGEEGTSREDALLNLKVEIRKYLLKTAKELGIKL